MRAHLQLQSLQRQLRVQNEALERRVAERTRELAQANARLLELGRLKDDFVRMISFEIRTPATGVLGIGELLLDLCPASEEARQYGDLFKKSGLRLRQLIEDAALIADMEKQPSPNKLDGHAPDDKCQLSKQNEVNETYIVVVKPDINYRLS